MFGTSGIRGRVGDVVTADLALAVGHAVVEGGADRIVIGRDPRESGTYLADVVGAGVREAGGDVVRLGMTATPTIARAVAWQDADAGIAVTASHNPAEDNGFKLWQPSGQAYDAAQRNAIETLLQADDPSLKQWDEQGTQSRWPAATDRHRDVIVDAVTVPDPPAVVVDLGNGAGGVTVDALLDLGCDVVTLNAQPDGRFPGRPSEPVEATLGDLAAQVAASDAALGIAHDGDADRMMAVDDHGRFVPGDVLLALFAREVAGAGDRVAAPLNTSLAVDDALADVGATLTRTSVGDVFVAERASEPDVVFGGEYSGAWIWPEETLCPDGPLAACKLVELVGDGSLAAIVDEIETYPTRRESVPVDDKAAVMARVERAVTERYDDVETTDGVRVDLGDAWFLVRASGTQPLVRVSAEARVASRADDVFAEARAVLEAVA